MWDKRGEIASYQTWLLWRLLWQQRQLLDLQLLGERGSVRSSDGLWWPHWHPSASTSRDMPSIP